MVEITVSNDSHLEKKISFIVNGYIKVCTYVEAGDVQVLLKLPEIRTALIQSLNYKLHAQKRRSL
jgi:hypothetical protein